MMSAGGRTVRAVRAAAQSRIATCCYSSPTSYRGVKHQSVLTAVSRDSRKIGPFERNAPIRRLSSAKPVPSVATRPPFLVRVSLIGSSITLATPMFAVAGVFRIWSSVLPKTAEGLAAKRIVSLLIGGGSVTLVWYYFLPFLRDYPELILPFAISNGVMAMLWHGVAEATVGLEWMAGETAHLASQLPEQVPKLWRRLPVGGALLGAATAFTAPLLWELTTSLCWSPELKDLLLGKVGVTWLLDTYYGAGLTVALPVGVLAGSSLHYVLKPFILGFAKPPRVLPWYSTSLPLLAAVTGACALYFGTSRLRGVGISVDDFLWMPRMDPKTGSAVSVNVRTGEARPGHEAASMAASKISLIQWLHYFRDPLQELRGYISGTNSKKTVAPPPDESLMGLSGPLAPTDITAANFADYSDLFLLVDLLVRYAHLQLHGDLYTKQIEALNVQALEEFGICNLKRLFRMAEVGCVTRRRYQRDIATGVGATCDRAGDSRALLLELQDKFKGEGIVRNSYDYNKQVVDGRGKKVLQLLSANLPTLEAELDSKLGYRIADGADAIEKETQLIKAYHSENAWDYYTSAGFLFKSTAVAAMVGAAVAAVSSISGGRR